jgi:hypothetical protein
LEFPERAQALRFSKIPWALPLHLNMLSTNDVKELIDNNNFQMLEAEKIFFGMTSVFILAMRL